MVSSCYQKEVENINEFISDSFTIIPNKYIKGIFKLPSEELLLLSILLMIKNNKGIAIFNIKWLCSLYNSTTSNTTISKSILNNLKSLSSKEIVKYYSNVDLSKEIEEVYDYSKSEIIFANISVDLDSNFTIIKDKYILKILKLSNYHKKANRSKLYTMCLYLLSCINLHETNTDYKLCNVSQNKITKETGVSSHSISKYNDILKELNILDYMNLILKNPIGGIRKKLPTYYCCYEDRAFLDKKKEYFVNTGYYEEILTKDKIHVSNKTSLKLKIFNLEEKEKNNKITPEEVLTLRELREEYKRFSSC